MNCAILFIANQREHDLAKSRINDKLLIEYTVNEIRRLDVDCIYLLGGKDIEIDGLIKRDNINEVLEEIGNKDGNCLLLSCLYPLIEKNTYEKLLVNDGAFVLCLNDKMIPVFKMANKDIKEFEKLDFKAIEIDKKQAFEYSGHKDIFKISKIIKKKVIEKWLSKGVIIKDPCNTNIGIDVCIDKGTVIGSGVIIEGKTIIGKNNLIDNGTYIVDSKIGDNNVIYDSKVINSVVSNSVKIGPDALIVGSEINDCVDIGSFVKISDSKIGKKTSIEHLSYIGSGIIGNNVKIGASVVTVNQDGRSKNLTIIKDNSMIGSNVNLIAPLTIGEFALVAAGSTIDEDVKDGDMAIARLYQQNKKGYGYKYTKED